MSLIIVIVFAILLWIVRISVANSVMRSVMYVYLGYWALSILVSLTNPYGFYIVSDKTYALLLINVIAFTAGVLVYGNKGTTAVKSTQLKNVQFDIEHIIDSKLFMAILIISDIILIVLYMRFAALLASYSAVEVRTEADLLFEGSSFLSLTYNLFLNPFCSIVMFLASYLIIFNRKKILPLLLMILFVYIYSEVTVSRLSFFRLFLCVIFILFCRSIFARTVHRRRRFSVGSFLGVISSVIIVFSILAFMTAQRNHGVNSFSFQAVSIGADDLLHDFASYSVGPFRAFDYAINADYISEFGGLQYGRSTLGFIDCFFELILRRVGVNYHSSYSKVIDLLQNEWIDIGGGSTFNFAYTAVFTHYIDLGYVGVILFPFLFGLIFHYFVRQFEKSQSTAILILLSYLFFVAVFTVFNWRLDRHNSTFLFIYLYFMNKLINRKMVIRH